MSVNTLHARTLAASAALCLAQAAQAAPTWVTIGDAALAVMKRVAPAAQVLSSTEVRVNVPLSRGSQQLTEAREGVHAVEIDDSQLEDLGAALHEQLHRCAGFVQHRSMAEALATLHQLSRPATQPGAVPSYVIDNQAVVNALLPQIQGSNLLSGIQQLSDFQNRRYNSSHGVAASNWLFNLWKTMGANRRDVRVSQVTHAGWPQKSVSFEIEGSGNGGETIIVGAHLDSIASGPVETMRAPGADDDASGVATLTEIIRVLMVNRYTPARSLRFVAYAAEEVGLRGSQEVVANYKKERKRPVGVLQLDMTAYHGDATDLWIYTDYTDPAQNQFLVNLAQTYLPTLSIGFDRCGYGCSDHASWFNQGYIASLPFEASDTTYNFQLHTVRDTIATFGNQADHALKFARLALAYAVELASDGAPPPVPTVAAISRRKP